MRSYVKAPLIAAITGLLVLTTGCAEVSKKVAEKAVEAKLSPAEKQVYDKCLDALNDATQKSMDALDKISKGDYNVDDTVPESKLTDGMSAECEEFFKNHPEQAARAMTEYADKNKGKLEEAQKKADESTKKLQEDLKKQQEELDKMLQTTTTYDYGTGE